MENTELAERITALERKVDAVYVSVEKTRKYFFFVLITSAIGFVVPLIGLLFVIPSFISSYTSLSSF
jgi:hypothetical protein